MVKIIYHPRSKFRSAGIAEAERIRLKNEPECIKEIYESNKINI